MFSLTSSNSYYLYKLPTDMRKSFDGLSGIISSAMKRDTLSGEVFLFISKSKDKLKLLRWEGDGFVIYYKRLEKGTLTIPADLWKENTRHIRWAELVLMIEGILIEKYRQKKRY